MFLLNRTHTHTHSRLLNIYNADMNQSIPYPPIPPNVQQWIQLLAKQLNCTLHTHTHQIYENKSTHEIQSVSSFCSIG